VRGVQTHTTQRAGNGQRPISDDGMAIVGRFAGPGRPVDGGFTAARYPCRLSKGVTHAPPVAEQHGSAGRGLRGNRVMVRQMREWRNRVRAGAGYAVSRGRRVPML
jgi:hypothetical protein